MNDEPPATQSPAVGMTDDFTLFMRRHQDRVYTTALRLLNNPAQAEDIAQEVFVKAHARFDELAGDPRAGGWLRTVATRMSLNHLKRYRSRWRFFSELVRRDDDGGDASEVEFVAPDADVLAALERVDRRERIEQALAELPERQRVPLVLFHFEELGYDEIATELGVSLAKVKTDILRGRAALARKLVRESDDFSRP